MNVWSGHSLLDYIMFKTPIKYLNRDVKTVSYVIVDLKWEIEARDKKYEYNQNSHKKLYWNSLPNCLKTH